MKVRAHCGYCLVHRGYREVLRATGDEAHRREAMGQILRLVGERFGAEAVPARIGTERDRLIRRVTGCDAPYAELKRRANLEALGHLPRLREMVGARPPAERLRTACLIACIGNTIEHDIPGHGFDIAEALGRADAEGLHIDDTDGFRAHLGSGGEVLLLADNAGEIVVDRLLAEELRALGCSVTVAVKGGPALNDATMEDAEASGIAAAVDRVIETGTDSLGVDLSEASEEFVEAFTSADAIVAKGMANWETMTEKPAPSPTLFLLRTKCEPVAASLGAPLNRNVAKLVPRGWRL